MDHFDQPSLQALESRMTRVITAIEDERFASSEAVGRVDELAWGESVQVGDLSVRAFEVNHWGARMQSDTYRGFNGYLIESSRYRVIFGGDTALTGNFGRCGLRARWIWRSCLSARIIPWIRAHCTPEQALQMANDAGGGADSAGASSDVST